MDPIKIGTEGHVSFLVLEPRVVSVRELVVERYSLEYDVPELRGAPKVTDVEKVVDGTRATGETVCEWGRVTGIDPAGLVTVSGFSSNGTAMTWRGVQVAPEPVPVTEEEREDPAGHAFHLVADCPWGR